MWLCRCNCWPIVSTPPVLHPSCPSPLLSFTPPVLHPSCPSLLLSFTPPVLHSSCPPPIVSLSFPTSSSLSHPPSRSHSLLLLPIFSHSGLVCSQATRLCILQSCLDTKVRNSTNYHSFYSIVNSSLFVPCLVDEEVPFALLTFWCWPVFNFGGGGRKRHAKFFFFEFTVSSSPTFKVF